MIYLALIGSVAAGVLAVLKCKLDDPHRLKLVTAFTGAYLMALTCLHLIPEVFGAGTIIMATIIMDRMQSH